METHIRRVAMDVTGVSSTSLAALLQSYLAAGGQATGSTVRSTSDGSAYDLRETYRLSLGLRKAIQELRQALQGSFVRPGHLQPSTAISSITLDPTTYTSLTGTEEVNATPTSFSPFGPTWKRGSTALATVTGIYDGGDGTTMQKIRVITGDTVGGSSAIVLRASIQSNIEDITIPAQTAPGTPFTLSNGLVISLSAGNLVRNDEFDVNLYDTVGSVADPNKPFNGTRETDPNLQYGLRVTDGSFTVNRVSINVAATDTLNQVLARITASAAGVTAAFDSSTETVRLSQKTPGALPIVFANDTSGFLAAAKLAGAIPVPGTDERVTPIANIPKLSAIASGFAYINDVAVAVDTRTDSIEAIVARINASGAGVTASFTDGRISFTSDVGFTLEDGTSNLFRGLGIAEGAYGSQTSSKVTGSERVMQTMERVSEVMNELFGSTATSSSIKSKLLKAFESVAASAFHRSGPRFHSTAGVHLDFGAGAEEVLRFSQQDRNTLAQALHARPVTVRKLFLSPLNGKGENFLDLLSNELKKVESQIEDQVGASGLLLNVTA
jgi:hypothetical protein